MPLAPVDDNGTVLFYEDSGIPDVNHAYTTLVLIHGITYNSDIFGKLVPFAAQYHLRLIRVNQRDYHPSSLFTTSEIEEFTSADKVTQSLGVRKRGVEIANLLVHLIDTLNLPPISVGGDEKLGGISVLGWSMGAHLPIALLGSASTLSDQVQQRLQSYLRSTILFDPSMFPVGVSIPPIVFTSDRPKGLYWPFFDTSISLEERVQRFGPWVSSYYEPTEDISTVTLEKLGKRSPVQDLAEGAFSALSIEPWKKAMTLDRIPPDELTAMSSIEATARYPGTLGNLDPSVNRGILRHALGLDDPLLGSVGTPLVWPECKVVLVWCDMTLVDCTIASATLVKLLSTEGSNVKRKVEVQRLIGANHFPHWDEPEKVVSFLAGQI